MVIVFNILILCIVLAAFLFGLRIGIATLIAIRPLTDRLFESANFQLAGYTMTLGLILNVIVIVALILNFSRIQSHVPAGLRYIWLPFLLVSAVAVLYSPLQIDAVRRLSIYVSYYSMFVLSFIIMKSERDVLFFLKLVILSSVVPVFYGLFQILSGVDRYPDSRIQSTFSHPNMLAFYAVVVIGVIVFLNIAKRVRIGGRLRLLLNLYLIPLLIVLVMTQTRGAWIGCFALFLLWGVVNDRRVLVAVSAAVVLAITMPTVSERLADLMFNNEYVGGSAVALNSYAWRQLLWTNSFAFIWQQPMLGYGLHSFLFYSPEFFSPAPGGTYAHNDYIQVLFETGVIGLLTFLWIFLRSLAWLVQHRRFDWGALTAAIGILAVYLICSYSDNLLEYLPFQWEFWFVFGVVCWHMAHCPVADTSPMRRVSLAYRSRLTRVRGLPASTGDAPGPNIWAS